MAKRGVFVILRGKTVSNFRRRVCASFLNFLLPGVGTAFLGCRGQGLIQGGLVLCFITLLVVAASGIYSWMIGLGFPLEAWREGFSSFPPEVQAEVEQKFRLSPPSSFGLPSLWLLWGSVSGLILVWFWSLVSVFFYD